ncbi:hypothetical protein HY285_00845 [Candidatus Peregrinibacteria bacterium]|nr:hypothetical protein [Candidatus Peregrinibacteria bacterium]MBI3816076.1 hypothetical protein [Candidatus Peregrinibacteria bacterium]
MDSRRMMVMYRSIDIVSILIAVAWFLFNVTLPDMFNGRLCCDSVGYIAIAKKLTSIQDVLTNYGGRTLGYPLFLKANFLMTDWLPAGQLFDGVTLSLVTALFLHLCSSFFLYHSVQTVGFKVHRAALWLLIIHPGLVSHAALPLTDGFATTLFMFAAGCMLRAYSGWHWKNVAWAAGTGALLGWIVLTRPGHLPAASLTIVLWMAIAFSSSVRIRHWRPLLMPLFCALLFTAALLPRSMECAKLDHRICLYTKRERDAELRYILHNRNGARTYSVLRWNEHHQGESWMNTVDDSLFLDHFQCLSVPKNVDALQGVLSCYWSRLPLLPFLFLKKTIALFDNLHLNTYAAYITTPVQRYYNRLFGFLGFAGFCLMLRVAVASLPRRQWRSVRWLLPVLYTFLYFSFSLLVHTEVRFGFPLVPMSFLFLVSSIEEFCTEKKFKVLIVFLLFLATVFFLQVYIWDLSDPLLTTNVGSLQDVRS